MNTDTLCFGQRYDEELGILEPWYTNPAMDVIKTWDLKDKIIMEWGMGASTIWWAKRAKLVLGVDHNYEWFTEVSNDLNANGLITKANIAYIQTHEGDNSTQRDKYVKHFEENNKIITEQYPQFKPVEKIDIAIVDGIHRYECAEYAVKVLKPEILIIDNWQQAFIFMCPAAVDLLKDYRCEIFTQENHEDHDGVNKWKTGIWYLKEKIIP